VFRDDDDNEAQQFMETDIDAAPLERSTKSVSYRSATNTISKGLGSFSKASFVTSNVDGGQDLLAYRSLQKHSGLMKQLPCLLVLIRNVTGSKFKFMTRTLLLRRRK